MEIVVDLLAAHDGRIPVELKAIGGRPTHFAVQSAWSDGYRIHDLRFAAGNFYVNDKPTGAVVGQQPFGGSRASGTNDKAGSYLNLIRWTSQRTIKENFIPPKHFSYPFMDEE